MPEISLKEYLGKLNSLLNSNAADEVIHHCRHILQYYPKNVTAYRYLGRALVLNGRMEEGRDALRRVLSVIPDDYVAHLGLSEANERLNHPDEAIWHLERALEQRPNDKDLIDALRGLYRRYRGVDNAKIQLTSAAVARQYLRSSAYSQAIDALRRALTRMNDRLDLKLLLAQILWQQGSQEEAADIALDVLKILPDCLEANRIMAKLWLDNARPSDARRYVNALENLDPYLAVELVQGTSPDDDAFRLEELDYSRSSQSEITRARPDWLQEISATAPPVFETTKEASGDDWGNWASSLLSSQQQETTTTPERFVPSARNAPAERANPFEKAEPISSSGMTDVFGRNEDANTGELAAIFGDVRPGDEDPMAWLRDTGVELVDQAEETPDFQNLFDDDEGSIPEAESPMAWLRQESGTSDDDSDPMAWLKQNAAVASDDEDGDLGDPFAWMEQNAAAIADAQSSPMPSAQVDDSLDWLQDSTMLDEALGAEGLSTAGEFSSSGGTEWNPPGFDEEPTNDASVPSPADQGVPGARRGLTAILSDGTLDWMNKQDENAVTDDDMDAWENMFAASEPIKSVTDVPDWLGDLDTPETAEKENDAWYLPNADDDESEFPSTPEFPMGVAGNAFADMSAEDENAADESEFPANGTDDDETPDWEAELPGQEGDADDEFAWMEDESEAESAELPDWMSELAPKQGMIGTAAAVPPAVDDAIIGDDVPSWLTGITPESASEAEPEAEADDSYGWLSDEGNVKAGAEATISMNTRDFPWMAQGDDSELEAEGEDEGEAVAGATPDWLTGLEPEAEAEGEPEAVAGATPDWLTGLEPEAEADSEAEAVSDFDWQNDTAFSEADAESMTEAASTLDWLTGSTLVTSGVEAEAEEGEAVPVAGSTPDWLSGLNIAPTSGEPAVIDSDYAWMTDTEDEEDEAAPVISDPEFTWMSNAASTPESEAEAEPEVVAGGLPDWLVDMKPEETESVPEPEAESVVDDGNYEWLNPEALAAAEVVASDEVTWEDVLPVQSDDEWTAEPASVVNEVSADTLAWSSEPETADGEAVAEEAPDWLAELAPMDVDTPSEPEPAAENDMSWLNEIAPAAEVAASVSPEETDLDWTPETVSASAESELVAGDVMDWLSELPPTVSTPEAELSAEARADSEYTWLTDSSPVAEDDEVLEDEDFTWMNADDEEEEAVAAAPIPIGDAADVLEDAMPDWLAEVKPEVEREPTETSIEDAVAAWSTQNAQADLAVPVPEVEEAVAWLDEELEPEAPPDAMTDSVPMWAAAQSEETLRDSEFGWLDEVEAEVNANNEAGLSEAEQAALEHFEPLNAEEWQSASEELAFDDENGWTPEAEPEAESAESFDDLEAVGEYDEDIFPVSEAGAGDEEAEEAEPLEASTAHSAPDWLNAMVPGLDVDYEPGEDELEEDEAPVAEGERREFAWVSDLVERETSATGMAQFMFSRPPRWFERDAPVTQNGGTDDDLPDWPSDDADVDVPEWLR